MNKKILFIIIALLVLNQTSAKQKFYKWTDSQGTIHYTQKKPVNKKTDELKINTAKTRIINEKPETDITETLQTEPKKTIDQRFAQRREDKQLAKEKAQENLNKCKKAKENLAKYTKAVRFRRQDLDTGEYTYLEDDQRAALIKKHKQTIKKICK